MAAPETPPIASPCILVCTMDKGLCLGCHRTIEEIAGWSAASDDEKRAILIRVAERQHLTAL